MGIERLNEFWPEWKVTELLGSGAFGKVYKAVDEEAGFPVYSAIKVLSIPSSEGEMDALESEGMTESETRVYFKGIVNDFVNEIKLMNNLKGAPNIVAVEAFKIAELRERIGWDIFIRMELLCSFKEYLKTHSPTEADVVKMAIDIATALETCQQKNIIHRDIKPANIFVDDFGNFKLGDFGIAKELEKSSGAVSAKGTFSYMAPEVARGQRYDHTVDIYSLGLVMYSLLNNNRPPFVDPYKSEVSYNERKEANDRRLSGEPIPPPCNASPKLSNLILTACSYDPAKRFKNASAFKKALLSFTDGALPTTVGATAQNEDEEMTVAVAHHIEQIKALPPSPKKRRKKKIGIILTVILLILVLSALAVLLIKSENKGDEDRTEITSADVTTDNLTTEITTTDDTAADSITAEDTKASDTTEAAVNSPVEQQDDNFVPVSPFAVHGEKTVKLGHYEQDDNGLNGKEEIEWIVLAEEGSKALVISKYALDCMQFNKDYVSVTWEESDIREWLNNEFYNSAFSENEKINIKNSYLMNRDNPTYSTDGGNDTYDRIFLLSIGEVTDYFVSDDARRCEATSYAQALGATNTDGCWWWLRSGGEDNYNAAVIKPAGALYSAGGYVNNTPNAVRPAMWIETEGLDLYDTVDDIIINIPSDIGVGDILKFGSYEQDNNVSNGSEAIAWRVLEREGNRVLLITDKAIDCRKYNDVSASVTWESCDLRGWLNEEFVDAAFSDAEKNLIETVRLTNEDNYDKGTDGGNDTNDRVFLLSIGEAQKYFSDNELRCCNPTAYAVNNGAFVSETYSNNCWWWLRSPGYVLSGAAVVATYGEVNTTGRIVEGSDNCVRPAIWINID